MIVDDKILNAVELKKILKEAKHNGIIRLIDELGRVVIPIEFREKRGYQEGTPVIIEKIDDFVTISKVQDGYSGIIRKIDMLGRPVIPIEIRKELNWNTGDRINIVLYKDIIILRKFSHKCLLCNKEKDLIEFNDKYICKKCINKILKKALIQ